MDPRLTAAGRKTNPTPVVGQRNVIITPIRAEHLQALPGVHQAISQLPPSTCKSTPLQLTSTVIDKTTLKAVPSGAAYKKDSARSFILRKIDSSKVLSCADLKGIINQQLQHDIVSGDFDVGYVQGASVIRVRSREDIQEMWSEIKSGKIALWCVGLKNNKSAPRAKRKLCDFDSDDEEDDDTRKKRQPARREEEVQDFVDTLKKKHGAAFTPMQLRIWAEMMAAGLHSSTDDPPNTSMFARAGGKTDQKNSQSQQVTQLLTDAATAITSAFANSSKSSVIPTGTSTSPAKMIESRSKLYKQLSDLHSLHSNGILTNEGFASEKQTIMEILQKLKN